MSDTAESRPDGRVASPETLRLRAATRALRLHLDELPVDYELDTSADQFLASLAFMFARQRYDCAESLIGSGFGGTVMGSMARSLFIDGLRWRWIAEDPSERRRTLLGDLLEERNRIVTVLAETESSCPILSRWLMPLPDVADLTGSSLSWLDAPAMPSETEMLNDLLTRPVALDTTSETTPSASSLLDIAGIRGVGDVLAFAGHGNFLGLQSSLTMDGAPGFDLRFDYEALFMHAAAVGVTTTLIGSTASVPDAWPHDVAQEPFLDAAVVLTRGVADAATAMHGLVAPRPARATPRKSTGRTRSPTIIRPQALLTVDDLLPEQPSPHRLNAVIAEAERFYNVARSMPVDPWAHGDPSLHDMLAYGGGQSNLETVMVTYDQPGGAVMAAFAARMLLEESARLHWRFSVSDETAMKDRAKQFFDEFRSRRRKTINALQNGGVPRSVAERLFAVPDNVIMKSPLDDIAKGRVPIPTVSTMLRAMGASYPESGWLEVAYSLLSQVVHSTPVGHLHTIRFYDGSWHGNELSPEMLALALDTACLGSAVLIGHSTVILTDLDEAAKVHYISLRRAADRVHDAARLVHGLD